MSLNKYVSEIKMVEHNEQVIFNYLSNFENLADGLIRGSLKK
jgi:hypothetical protein